MAPNVTQVNGVYCEGEPARRGAPRACDFQLPDEGLVHVHVLVHSHVLAEAAAAVAPTAAHLFG